MLARYKALQIGLILASELCFTQQGMALDLGELTLESNLSEPLDATIELLDVAGLDPSQISISLGTEEDFARLGTELSALASQVQFAVVVNGATGSVHLTTQDIVEEPFLDLVLNVSGPDGTVQREFTLLLDLPGAVTGPLVIPGTTSSSPPTTADAQFSRGDYGTGLSDDGQTYAVANGDSMWEIAARTRPSSDIGMQQMMLAIQRANEDAFINNNINRVLSGRVLRVPTRQEIDLVDQDAAVTQISQQNQELGVQPLAVSRTDGNNNAAPEQDELTVLTDDQSNAGAAGDSDVDATLAALENEMMLSEESLDRARLENAELTSRFKMLEEEMDLLQNIIAVEDARIAQLQAELAVQAETTEQALATTEEATNVLAAQQSAPQPGIAGNVSGWLQNTAVLMGVILALLLLVLGYLFWQRRRMDAAVYAFDSGIPELETADNSSFAPVEKSSGGIMGWFPRLGSKGVNKNRDVDFAADSGSLSLRTATNVVPDTQSNIEMNKTAATSYYLDEEQVSSAADPVSGLQNDAETFSSHQNASSQMTRTVSTEMDDAELADALIAEAKGISNHADEQAVPLYDSAAVELTEAEREAQALAELVTPDDEITESGIPESFEFTLKTAPEALAEEANIDSTDDTESFDFQLTESSAAGNAHSAVASGAAAHEMSDEELQLSTLLLDEDEGDFKSGAPMDECDTKLDLAVAYEAMGDIEGAIEILGEVIADGDSTQIAEANRLKGLWQNS